MKLRHLITILVCCLITYLLTAHFSSKPAEPEICTSSEMEMAELIIGTWTFNDDLSFTFYPNGRWSSGKLLESTNPIGDGGFISSEMTSSGEYCVVESGVFIRHFGSQHWIIEGDYTDSHTSIGAQYLTYREGALVNNQEDYNIEYVKESSPRTVIYEITSNKYVNTEGAKLLKAEGEVKHLVYPDESLEDIARYYQVPKKKIMLDNDISDEGSLKVGEYVTISSKNRQP